MESQYNPQRTRNIFSVSDTKPYKLSRSRIENYVRCKRCFYLDRKCGTEQPPMLPYTLNNAVDALEFDQYRIRGVAHPYVLEHGIDAIPMSHPELTRWRTMQWGIQYHHKLTNFMIAGVVDDVWINSSNELIIVDYKATSTKKDIFLRESYKRQMEVYQWLFRKNGFVVSNTSYFVYCNADDSHEQFNNVLQFNISLLPYVGNDSWVENTLLEIKACLMKDVIPEKTKDCNYCGYWDAVKKHVEK